MANTETSFDGLLTEHQRRDLEQFADDVERIGQALHGAREMGMDVPPVDFLSNYYSASNHARYPTATFVVPLEPYGAQDVYVLRTSEGGSEAHYLTVQLKDLPWGNGLGEWDNLTPSETLLGVDAALELTPSDLPFLERLGDVAGAWVSYLSGYIAALMPDLRYPSVWYPGVRGEDGSLYMQADETLAQRIVRPDGTVLHIGHGLQAADDPDGEYMSDDDRALGARIHQLRDSA